MNKIEYDPFVTRQFSQNFSGTKLNPEIKDEFINVINISYDTISNGMSNTFVKDVKLLDSEWDFCKYLVLEGQEFYFDDSVEWGIVSIMGTVLPHPDPLVPITIMRNALGVEEGGNGETLNRKVYNESVDFWSKYILVK